MKRGVYVLDRNANILEGWPVEEGWNLWSTPALGDFDGDKNLEISASRLGFVTYLFYHNGTLVSGWPQSTSWNDYYGSIMGDINNDGSLDLLTTSGTNVYAWNYHGDSIDSFPKITEIGAQSPAAIDDIDNDGKLELIASSDWDRDVILNIDKYRGSIYVWELDGNYSKEKMPWPMFQHDAQHTGCYDCEKTRPQSKIVNKGKEITGRLVIKIQKNINLTREWQDYKIVYDGNKSINSNSMIKLDSIFNPLNISVNEAGNYRVYAEFMGKSSSFAFNVE